MQKQKQAKHQGQRTHGESGVSRLAAPSAVASALKGYNLTADTVTEVPTSIAESVQPQSLKTQEPVAAIDRPSRSGRNPSGNASHAQSQKHSRPAGNPSVPSTTNIDAKRDSFARKAKRNRAAFEGKL